MPKGALRPDVRDAEPYTLPKTLSTVPAFVRRHRDVLKRLRAITTATKVTGLAREVVYVLRDTPDAARLLDELLNEGILYWGTPASPLHRGHPKHAKGVHDVLVLPPALARYVDPEACTLGAVRSMDTSAHTAVTSPTLVTPILHLTRDSARGKGIRRS